MNEASQDGTFELILKETFLNQLLAEQRTEEGAVRDFILGADVVGSQRTVSQSSVDLLPDAKSAALLFRLNGTTQNQTTSFTPQAAIKNCGQYQFELTKRVQFDGNVVSTWSPAAFLKINQKNIGAETPFTPLPLFGRISEQTAINIANQRLPEAEQIAAFKVTQQVAPQFNDQVDREIVRVNQTLIPNMQAWLKTSKLADLKFSSRTTDTELVIAATTGPSKFTQDSHQFLNSQSSGVVALDEGFLNNLIHRIPLAGMRISDTQLEEFVDHPSLSFSERGIPKLFTIVLDAVNPLNVELRNGALEAESRFSIQPILGESLGTRLLRIRITANIVGDSVQLDARVIKLSSMQNPETDNLSSELIISQLNKELEPFTIPGRFPLSFLDGYPAASLKLLEIAERSGELRIEYQIGLKD